MRFVASIAVALSLIVTTSCSRPAVDAQKGATHRVVIDGTRFQPDELTIAVGDSIVWVNNDPFPHTATSTDADFDSGEIAPTKSWTFKAVKAGDFPYVCTLHRSMKGTVHVK